MKMIEQITESSDELTLQEIEAARWLEEMIPGSYFVLKIIKNLSLDQKKSIYSSAKKRKPECYDHFKTIQKRWLEEHEVYVDKDLIYQHRDHSHKTINSILTDETLNYTGENVRCCIFYAMMFPENIDPPKEVLAVRKSN
jgi:hypothetical protein